MGSFLSSLWNWIYDASMLIAPRQCSICGRRLRKWENILCTSCYNDLPFTHIRGTRGNKVERIFWNQIPIVRANSFMYYTPHSNSNHIFLQLKYLNRPEVGRVFGRIMAMELIDTDFFQGLDTIIPVPLAKDRQRKRGYNQSEMLAQGISEIIHIPVDTKSVKRVISNQTQTQLNARERKENVKNIFALASPHYLDQKHILLIDDVLTTGATLLSCAQEIAKVPNVRISIMTLGLAGNHFALEKQKEEDT